MASTLFDLTGKLALVTGSTSGIGFELARGLADAGAKVIINGRDQARVDAAVAALASEGRSVAGATFDVTDRAGVDAGIASLEAAHGPLDILVNNAGIQRRKPLLELDEETWHEVMRTNLDAVFYTGRAAARGMVERGHGKIINICSLMSEVARRTIAPYTAAKGAVRQLTKSMCIEWAPHGLQINGIGPGYIATPLNAALIADPAFDGWVKARTPAGRWGRPDELAGAAVFLASKASDFMNGQILYIDGGLLAGI